MSEHVKNLKDIAIELSNGGSAGYANECSAAAALDRIGAKLQK